MKRILQTFAITVIAAFMFMAKADNTWFEHKDNFTAVSYGSGVVHFRTLTFAEGSVQNHWAGTGKNKTTDKDGVTRIYYIVEGETTEHNILSYYTKNKDNKEHSDRGWVKVYFFNNSGCFHVTNQYGTTSTTVCDNGSVQEKEYWLQRQSSGDKPTYLEVDWQIPVSLAGKQIKLGIHVEDRRYETAASDPYSEPTYDMGTFHASEAPQSPSIYDPVFYPTTGKNVQLGSLGVPYATYQEPRKYHTSIDSTKITCTEQGGVITIPSSDSVIKNFSVTFTTKHSQDIDQTLVSNTIHVPAYHRIYGFNVNHRSRTNDPGHVVLSWYLKYPKAGDILSSDVFQIQRAFKADFSDVETIGSVSYNADVESDTLYTKKDTVQYSYIDSAQSCWAHNGKVYYRICRASASVWDWDELLKDKQFAAQDSIIPSAYQLPITECTLKKDEKFDEDRSVDITVKLSGNTTDQWFTDPQAKIVITRTEKETSNAIKKIYPATNLQKIDDQTWTLQVKDQPQVPCVHYEYKVALDTVGCSLHLQKDNPYNEKTIKGFEPTYVGLDPDDLFFSTSPTITDLNATEDIIDYTLVQWQCLVDADFYTIEFNDGETHSYTTSDSFLKDSISKPGQNIEYKINSYLKCNGITHTDSSSVTGRISRYGRIKGQVINEDGSAMVGVNVNISGNNGFTRDIKTDALGTFTFDSLEYDLDKGSTYSIEPTDQFSNKFVYGGSSEGVATITLKPHHASITGVEFTNTTSNRFSGMVIYSGTSVPVRNAQIKLNGNTVLSRGKEPVLTDAQGKFSIQIPKGNCTVQIVKDGHKMQNNGFFKINGSETFSISKPVDGLIMHDSTRVRVIGRITGGAVEGSKILGFGLSQNTIGDDLQMIIELEGDNTSRLIYEDFDHTITERDSVIQHLTKGDSTKIHTTLKRIEISPDPRTGEFYVDLIPTKFKITQLNAKGYSTLFASGTGIQTLNLESNAFTHDTLRYDGKELPCNATFNYIYRADPLLELTQEQYGVTQNYFGDKQTAQTNICGKNFTVNLVEEDGDSIRYLFGYPVFRDGNYQFRITASENYYYNNDKKDKHNRVMLPGTVTIYNGLNDENKTVTATLGSSGTTSIVLPAHNVTFALSDSAALRTVNMSMNVNGEFIESKPMKAYVTGNRTAGNSVITKLGTAILPMGVLRDPYGAGSYSWLEKGATYSTSYSINVKFGGGVKITIGKGVNYTGVVGVSSGAGPFSGTVTTTNTVLSATLPITFDGKIGSSYTYNFTTNSRIETSSNPYFSGAMADVYYGNKIDVVCQVQEVFRVIDDTTYKSVLPAINANKIRVVSKSADSTSYLVVAEELKMGQQLNVEYQYSQKYIAQELIPDLVNRRNALLEMGDSASLQTKANDTKKTVYWSKVAEDDEHFGEEGYYSILRPKDITLTGDDVYDLGQEIATWLGLIAANEMEKYQTRLTSQPLATYDMSSATSHTYSESAAHSNSHESIFNAFSGSISASGLSSLFKGAANVANAAAKILRSYKKNGKYKSGNNVTKIKTPASNWEFSIDPVADIDLTRDNNKTVSYSRTSGFKLETSIGSTLTQTVYSIVDSTFKADSESDRKEAYNYEEKDNNESRLSANFVFFCQGGATRCPYQAADSAYTINGVVLSNATQRIERPTIHINTHEISSVPEDDAAIFHIRLCNESDIADQKYPYLETFTINLDEASNAKGLKIYMDGLPISDGRKVYLKPGESIEKTIEVRRGAGYDFEDVKLQLYSDCDTNTFGEVVFAVHYIPSSCNVNISSPTDKWVMNTLSPKDSLGYYLPIEINQFDINYREFDHIEFQYKKSTESDEKWVNLCSYYASDSLFRQATGTKEMIPTTGHINTMRFRGETDPIEQNYDLRAVSFCRYGSGYVTRSSKVLSGIKDTRPPRLFGIPTPKNGILTFEEVISIPFSEAIAGNYLSELNNFQILGMTNSTGITTGTSLHFNGKNPAKASDVRNITGCDLTIDMIVLPDDTNREQVFFATDDTKPIIFGMTADRRLFININDMKLHSKTFEPMLDFTRVVVTYDADTDVIRFYVGTQDMTDSQAQLSPEITTPNGVFCYGGEANDTGRQFAGRMLECRVWRKALGNDEIVLNNMKHLTGYEIGLVAYYPMTEGTGLVAKDWAHGSNLTLNGQNWELPKGMSIKLNKTNAPNGISLNPMIFQRSKYQDMTLSFWWKLNSKADTVNLLTSDYINVKLATDGLLLQMGKETERARGAYMDEQWHEFTLTVNRASNESYLYIDNKLCSEIASTKIGALTNIIMANKSFDGNIGHIVLWEQSLSSSLLNQLYRSDLAGSEMGILGIVRFYRSVLSEFGKYELQPSLMNERLYNDAVTGRNVLRNEKAVMEDYVNYIVKDDYPPLRSYSEQEKLNFSWISRDNELMIDLNMQDREINKNNIFITVRDVEDLNGNPMQSPISMIIYVDRNRIRWTESKHTVELKAKQDTIIKLQINNGCGTRTNYTVECNTNWISIPQPTGTIEPEATNEVEIKISNTLDPGTYSCAIYLTDASGLSDPVTIELKVIPNKPDWEVDKTDLNLSMNLRGKVYLSETTEQLLDDPEDIVAAFIGDRCVGVSNNSKEEQGILYMTIYGKKEMGNALVNFRLWRASTGRVYTLTTDQKINMTNDACWGCTKDPIKLTASAESNVQLIGLRSGWNWISTYLDPGEGDNINRTFWGTAFSTGDMIKSSPSGRFSSYNALASQWEGTLKNITYTYAYKLYCQKGGTVEVFGKPLTNKCIALYQGWNELPYLSAYVQELSDAMSAYYNYAAEGDYIKSYDAFAIFTSERQWKGTLKVMTPGEGYMLYKRSAGKIEFCYGKDVPVTTTDPSLRREEAVSTSFEKNMPIVAKVSGVELDKDDYIEVLYNGIRAGIGQVGEDGLIFIMTYAPENATLTFRLIRGENTIGTSTAKCTFNGDAIVGSPDKPFIISFDETDEQNASGNDGMKILHENKVYIMHDSKWYDTTGKKSDKPSIIKNK